MPQAPEPVHADTLEVALEHYNRRFRMRYRLPATTAERLQCDVPEIEALLADLASERANGVADASCALIARIVLSIVPRYAIGFLDGDGRATVDSPEDGVPEAYWGHHVILVNPLGGRDNWASVSKWVHSVGGDKARQTELAGLASESRPDDVANWELLTRSAAVQGRAIMLPPDEGFSAARAAEVSYIYGVRVETLRSWKKQYRGSLANKKPGAPRKNR